MSRNDYPPVLATQIPQSVFARIQFPVAFQRPRNPYKYNILASPPTQEQKLICNLLESMLNSQNNTEVLNHQGYSTFQSLSLDNQLKCFVSSRILTDDQIRVRWQLAVDVLYNLRFFYPQCQVYGFGSLLTGLADPGSDIDLYVDIFGDDGKCLQGHKDSGLSLALKKIQDDLKAIMNYSKCPHSGRDFARAVVSMGTRIPFIRFRHTSSRVQCDLSFSSRLSVQNSKLILFYLNYDQRVGPFMVFLRYWARFHRISGEMEIKQYALSLIAVVFLTKKKIIPSIYLLQKLAAEEREMNEISENPDEFDGWNASFCENREIIDKHFQPELDNDSSPGKAFLEMVLEFCEMFAFLDLSSVVICPLAGEIVQKELLTSPGGDTTEELPEALRGRLKSMIGFEYVRRLCVQDPFALNFNVGGIAKADVVKRFQKACKVTYEKLRVGGGDEIKSLLELFVSVDGIKYGEKL